MYETLKAVIRRAGWRRLMAVTILLSGLVGGYWYYLQTAPYRVMWTFIRAAETQDATVMYRLADEREKRELGLTIAGIASVLHDTVGRPVRFDGFAKGTQWYSRPGSQSEQYEAYVRWADPKTGNPIPSDYSRQFWSTVVVKPTAEGWRIGVSHFLFSTSVSRWNSFYSYDSFARQASIHGHINVAGELVREMPYLKGVR